MCKCHLTLSSWLSTWRWKLMVWWLISGKRVFTEKLLKVLITTYFPFLSHHVIAAKSFHLMCVDNYTWSCGYGSNLFYHLSEAPSLPATVSTDNILHCLRQHIFLSPRFIWMSVFQRTRQNGYTPPPRGQSREVQVTLYCNTEHTCTGDRILLD